MTFLHIAGFLHAINTSQEHTAILGSLAPAHQPSCLVRVASPAGVHHPDALFVGSRVCASRLLQLPAVAPTGALPALERGAGPAHVAAAEAAAASNHSHQAHSPATQPALQEVGNEAFGSCLGPVFDAVVIPDPCGSGDGRLLACCGAAPHGRLVSARVAAQLCPHIADGPLVPVRCKTLSARGEAADLRTR